MALNISIFEDLNLDSTVSFIDDIAYMRKDEDHNIFFENSLTQSEKYLLDICSDSKKIIVRVVDAFFHFYAETFASFLYMHYKNPDAEVIVVDCSPLQDLDNKNKKDSQIKMFFLFLKDRGISYRVLKFNTFHAIKINNYFLCDYLSYTDARNQGYLLSEMAKEYSVENNKNSKVYIRTGRVKDEPELEEYLESIGFEVVDHTNFVNFVDQIIYYYNAKVLISATSGGLTNLCFMKDNSVVIELITLVPQRESVSHVHHIYDTLSLQKNHIYLGLSNINKDAKDIIAKFKSKSFFKDILEA